MHANAHRRRSHVGEHDPPAVRINNAAQNVLCSMIVVVLFIHV
jgi:hypothetical protein